jgi:hypothetical protein
MRLHVLWKKQIHASSECFWIFQEARDICLPHFSSIVDSIVDLDREAPG